MTHKPGGRIFTHALPATLCHCEPEKVILSMKKKLFHYFVFKEKGLFIGSPMCITSDSDQTVRTRL